jgi:DNA repair exonuclease SbcCD nuclease subunit
MYRFIIFSDLHLNSWTYGSDVSKSWNSRLEGQYRSVSAMFEYAAVNSIKTVFFCGDFFHTPSKVAAEVLQTAARLRAVAKANGLQVILLEGNHDKKSDFISALTVVDAAPTFDVVAQQRISETEDGIPYAALPYTTNPRELSAFLDGADLADRVVLLHQGVSGVEINSKGFTLNEILQPDMIPDNVLHAFAGHYHSYKRVGQNLTIPGSMMQLNWGDKGEARGFIDVMWDGANLHMKRMTDVASADAPSFIEIALSKVREMAENEQWDLNNQIVRVIRDADISDDAIRSLAPLTCVGSLEIVNPPRDDLHLSEVDASQFDSMTTLFEEYVTHCNLDTDVVSTGRNIINETT